MRYGITLPITGGDGDLHKLVDLAVRAEQDGYLQDVGELANKSLYDIDVRNVPGER